jgi:hypothetical protein
VRYFSQIIAFQSPFCVRGFGFGRAGPFEAAHKEDDAERCFQSDRFIPECG